MEFYIVSWRLQVMMLFSLDFIFLFIMQYKNLLQKVVVWFWMFVIFGGKLLEVMFYFWEFLLQILVLYDFEIVMILYDVDGMFKIMWIREWLVQSCFVDFGRFFYCWVMGLYIISSLKQFWRQKRFLVFVIQVIL